MHKLHEIAFVRMLTNLGNSHFDNLVNWLVSIRILGLISVSSLLVRVRPCVSASILSGKNSMLSKQIQEFSITSSKTCWQSYSTDLVEHITEVAMTGLLPHLAGLSLEVRWKVGYSILI